MPIDVRKTITDTGYVAVGIGVLGVQQIQSRARALRARVQHVATPLGARAERTCGAVRSSLDEATKRAQSLPSDMRDRVQPLVARLEARLAELPQPLNRFAEPVERARRAFAA